MYRGGGGTRYGNYMPSTAYCQYGLPLWYEHVMPYSNTTCHATNGMAYGTRLATAICHVVPYGTTCYSHYML